MTLVDTVFRLSRGPGPSARLGRPLDLLVHAVARLWAAAAAAVDRRRTGRLLGLDDRMLTDIGVTRADVYAAVLTTARSKASEHLANLRAEHRAGERAQVRESRSAVRGGLGPRS